jgi:heme/copper-type cytochrome/quinol oxidase subunit 1
MFKFSINKKFSYIKKIILFIGVNKTFFFLHFNSINNPRRYVEIKDKDKIYYKIIKNNGKFKSKLKLFFFIFNFIIKYLFKKEIIKINKNPYLIEFKTKKKKYNFEQQIKIILC